MPDEGTSAMATSLPCRYSLDLTPEMAVTDSLVLSLVRYLAVAPSQDMW
jgi:hypothetical protein